jgi:hypothetical protein
MYRDQKKIPSDSWALVSLAFSLIPQVEAFGNSDILSDLTLDRLHTFKLMAHVSAIPIRLQNMV